MSLFLAILNLVLDGVGRRTKKMMMAVVEVQRSDKQNRSMRIISVISWYRVPTHDGISCEVKFPKEKHQQTVGHEEPV